MHSAETLAAFHSGLYPRPNRNASSGFPTLFPKNPETSVQPILDCLNRMICQSIESPMTVTAPSFNRPISLPVIMLVALAVHGPLLLMQLPAVSFDANLHIF